MVGRIQIEIKHCIAFLSLLYLTGSCTSPANTTDLHLYSTDSIRSGDIILRKSYGLISDIIVMQLKDTLDISHCGIIVKDENQNYKVIHALSKKVSDTDGVQICTLEYFMNDSQIKTVKVMRFRNDTTGTIAKKAFDYLKLKIPFDEVFNAKDTTSFYCSEFPIHIIKTSFGVDISQQAAMPKFSVFLNPVYFDEIPFVQKANQYY